MTGGVRSGRKRGEKNTVNSLLFVRRKTKRRFCKKPAEKKLIKASEGPEGGGEKKNGEREPTLAALIGGGGTAWSSMNSETIPVTTGDCVSPKK